MRILDRYILKSVFGIFLGCLLTFAFLYVIIDVFSHLDEILKQKVTIIVLLKYYASFMPIIFAQVTPICCLLSTLYAFGKLNRDNEVIAMRSSGLSVMQIARTIIVFSLLVSAVSFWIGDKIIPSSLAVTEKIKDEMEKGTKKGKEKQPDIIDNLSMYGLRNRLFFISRFDFSTNTMYGITILGHDEKQNIINKIVAKKAVYTDGIWKFYHSITYDFTDNGQIKGEPRYAEEELVAIPEKPSDFLVQRQRSELMTISEIDNYIWRLSRSGANSVINNLKVDLYQRFTYPLTSVVIVLLGIPFALTIKKRATGLYSLGISIMVGFLYYVINAISIALGKKGVFPPFLAASFSHIITLSYSIYLIRKLP